LIIKKAYNYEGNFQIFNLGYSSPIKILNFLRVLEEIIDHKAEIVYIGNQAVDVTITYADSSKTETILGFKPRVGIKKGYRNVFRLV
jgi:UDP-glucuronate 4-epimerase